MKLSATRHLLAMLHEVLQAIVEADRAGLLTSSEFRQALEQTPRAVRRMGWPSLLSAALGDAADLGDTSSGLQPFLVQARNNLASHYDQSLKLMDGYENHFRDLSKGATTAYAYVSFGATVEATRFYFADAAAQRALLLLDPDESLETAFRHLDTVAVIVGYVVLQYLHVKEQRLRRDEKRGI